MPNHEHFRELCALAAISQLSSQEERELNQHLYDCPSCRAANADFAHVVQHQLPQADPIRWRLKWLVPKGSPEADLRDRFLARAHAEGIEFTPDIELRDRQKRNLLWPNWRWQLTFATVTIAAIAVWGFTASRFDKTTSVTDSKSRLALDNDNLRAQLSEAQQNVQRESSELVAANKEKSGSDLTLQRLQRELQDSGSQSDALKAQLSQMQSKQLELANANNQKDGEIAQLNARNDKLTRDNAENLSARVFLESQVHELNNSIGQQASNFEKERQLTTASQDVRQLMGARNLHIMDVHDIDGVGKSARAFGRVFYAEGQTLIFYAFDLPSGKLAPAKYTFEAWGQKESVSASVRNLGTFAIDDHEQRRWVLKVNNPKLLQGIDSVFVTAEPVGNVGEPHGKKLLYAFIVGEPNHP